MLNHNVRVSLVWSLLENVSASMRSGDVMSAYLYLLTKSNAAVGVVQVRRPRLPGGARCRAGRPALSQGPPACLPASILGCRA